MNIEAIMVDRGPSMPQLPTVCQPPNEQPLCLPFLYSKHESLLHSTKTIHNNSIFEKVSETYNKTNSTKEMERWYSQYKSQKCQRKEKRLWGLESVERRNEKQEIKALLCYPKGKTFAPTKRVDDTPNMKDVGTRYVMANLTER